MEVSQENILFIVFIVLSVASINAFFLLGGLSLQRNTGIVNTVPTPDESTHPNSPNPKYHKRWNSWAWNKDWFFFNFFVFLKVRKLKKWWLNQFQQKWTASSPCIEKSIHELEIILIYIYRIQCQTNLLIKWQ